MGTRLMFTFTTADKRETYPYTTRRTLSQRGEMLWLDNTPAFSSDLIDERMTSLWRYRRLLVPDEVQPITLGEGWTPLITAQHSGRDIHLKLESLNPSGSFKDRAAAVLVSVMQTMAISEAHDDSSGNAGAALAAYAARAGIQAKLFVPAYASPVKLAQIRLYGAQLEPVEGPRSASTEASLQYAAESESYYASHAHNPFILAANQSIAWELWEQLGRRAPDAVVLPVGHGTQLLGLALGFDALLNAGLIEQLPRLVGVQAAACAPLWAAYAGTGEPPREGKTLAEGIRIANPVRGEAVINAVRRSGGVILTVSEAEIRAGLKALAHRGISAEPTCAVVWSALDQLDSQRDAVVVLSITGNGLKTPTLNNFNR